MNKTLPIKILICFAAFTGYLYSVLQKQNKISKLSFKLPRLEKELRSIEEENIKLRYKLNAFTSPEHLLALLKQSEYSHLKFYTAPETLKMNSGIALKEGTPRRLRKADWQRHENVAVASHETPSKSSRSS